MNCKAFGKSVIGGREKNQDAMAIYEDEGIYAVADGVGGGLHGELASQMAVEGLKGVEPGPEKLRERILELQDAVYSKAMELIGEAYMGTTLTCVRRVGNHLELCHVGDSRFYLYSEGVLKQITNDHEIFEESLQAPVLASYLGIGPDVAPITIQQETVPILPGDRIVLCSDGLYKQVSENRIVEFIKNHDGSPEEMLEIMCQEASVVEHSDNITVVYLQIDN